MPLTYIDVYAGPYTTAEEDGEVEGGQVEFLPEVPVQDTVGNTIVAQVPVIADIDPETGIAHKRLLATDSDGLQAEFAYQVTEKIIGSQPRTRRRSIEIPKNSPGGALHLADVADAVGAPVWTYVTLATFNTHVEGTAAENVHEGYLTSLPVGQNVWENDQLFGGGRPWAEVAAFDPSVVDGAPLAADALDDAIARAELQGTNVIAFTAGLYDLNGLRPIGDDKVVLLIGATIKGGLQCGERCSVVDLGGSKFIPWTVGGAGGADLAIYVPDNSDFTLVGGVFDRTTVRVENTTDTESLKRVRIRGPKWIGNYAAWATGEPLEVLGVSILEMSDLMMDVQNVYRFAKLTSSAAYVDVPSTPVTEAYVRKMVAHGWILNGSMNAANKQVIDCYAGVGEALFDDIEATITGTPSYFLEAKNAGDAVNPTTTKHNFDFKGRIKGSFSQAVIRVHGARAEAFADGTEQICTIDATIQNALTGHGVQVDQMSKAKIRGVIELPDVAGAAYVVVTHGTRDVDIDVDGMHGSIFVGDTAGGPTDPPAGTTRLVKVRGQLLEPRALGAVELWDLGGAARVDVSHTQAYSTSGTHPTGAFLYLNGSALAALTCIGNEAQFALAGTEVILLAAGSTIAERTEFGNSWNPRIDFGTAPPVAGTYKRGDRRYNIEPAAGGPPGWVCVAGGTPGTWKADANLAA